MNEVRGDASLSTSVKEEVTIMLADDHPLLRKALRQVLETEADFKIVSEVGDGEEAIRIATELLPDVIIMDISIPKINGIEATRQIKERCPNTAVLVLTVHDDSEHIMATLEAGAAGYLIKTIFSDSVVQAVRGVLAGESVLSPSVLKQIIGSGLLRKKQPIDIGAGEKITSRELDILKSAAKGMTNKEIALEFSISLRTVKSHLQDIFLKLQVASRTEAVIVGLRNNVFTMDEVE